MNWALMWRCAKSNTARTLLMAPPITTMLGDTFTVADAYLFALTGWGQADWLKSYYKADIYFDELRNLQAWYGRVLQRPAVQQALQAEGLT